MMNAAASVIDRAITFPLSRRVDTDLAARIGTLHRRGFSLIALGGGADGKEPRGPFAGSRWPVGDVLGRMRGGSMYGIRLDDLVVVDMDSDTREARAYVRDRFGESTVQVETSRGRHHYFRGTASPCTIRIPEASIDIKAGSSSYVVGPDSVRPDTGVIYDPIVGDLGVTELPAFHDHLAAVATRAGLAVGTRNDSLFRRALGLCRACDSESDLLGEMLAERNLRVDDPGTFSDAEVAKIVGSVWRYRVEGRLWSGRNSTYWANNRMLLDQLVPDGHHDAFVLYHILVANHGHLARPFFIKPDAMIRDGLWGKGRDTLYQARDVLLAKGLIRSSKGYRFVLSPSALDAQPPRGGV